MRGRGSRCRPRCPSRRAGAPRGGAGLPLGLRRRRGGGGALGGGGIGRGAEALARRLLAAFGRERFRVELQRPLWRRDRARNRWLAALGERLGVPCVATGTPTPTTARGWRSRTRWWRCGWERPWTRPRGCGAATRLGPALGPAEARERFRDHPEAVAESVRLARAAALRPHQRPRLQLSRRRGRDRGPPAGRALPGRLDGTAGATDSRAATLLRIPRRGRGAAGGGAGADPALRLSGFFLLHHDMLELAREVALEVRGPDSARRLLPPGPRAGARASARSSAT